MRRAWWSGVLPLLCGAVLLFSAPAGAALVQPQHDESGDVIVTVESAEVREGPATNFEVITLVGKGEIFAKQGRTGAWYLIKINDETSGWVSGRAVRRYQPEGAEEPAPPYVAPEVVPEEPQGYPYYPYYPEYQYYPYYYGYYDYYSYWGWPYYSRDWYGYGHGYTPYRSRTWYGDRRRDWNHGDGGRPRNDNWHRDYYRPSPRYDSSPRYNPGPRSNSPSHPPAPRLRPPMPHR
jgi:hypothetical protein